MYLLYKQIYTEASAKRIIERHGESSRNQENILTFSMGAHKTNRCQDMTLGSFRNIIRLNLVCTLTRIPRLALSLVVNY